MAQRIQMEKHITTLNSNTEVMHCIFNQHKELHSLAHPLLIPPPRCLGLTYSYNTGREFMQGSVCGVPQPRHPHGTMPALPSIVLPLSLSDRSMCHWAPQSPVKLYRQDNLCAILRLRENKPRSLRREWWPTVAKQLHCCSHVYLSVSYKAINNLTQNFGCIRALYVALVCMNLVECKN